MGHVSGSPPPLPTTVRALHLIGRRRRPFLSSLTRAQLCNALTGLFIDVDVFCQVLDGVGVGGTEKAEAKFKFTGKVCVRCCALFSQLPNFVCSITLLSTVYGLLSMVYCLRYRSGQYTPFFQAVGIVLLVFNTLHTASYLVVRNTCTTLINSTNCPDFFFF